MKLDENILKTCQGLVMNCNCKVLILDVLGEHRVFLVNDVHLKTRELVGVLFRLKIAQAPAGLGQRGVGLVLLHSLAGFIQAVIHADIVFLSHFVKRNISFYFFSSHRFKIPHFSTELDFYSIIRNCERP